MNSCENCQCEHDGTYGSGRFCSEKCARAFVTKAKRKEINEKVSTKLSGRTYPNRGYKLPRKLLICSECGQTKEVSITNFNRFCSRSCAMSYSQKKLAQDGKHNGFPSRKEKKPSWAEQFVIDFLNQKNIKFIRDYKVNRFFADFAFIDKMVILEIDGKQHNERKEYDQNRDSLISKEGWTIVRIQWKHRDFEYMRSQMENFIASNL